MPEILTPAELAELETLYAASTMDYDDLPGETNDLKRFHIKAYSLFPRLLATVRALEADRDKTEAEYSHDTDLYCKLAAGNARLRAALVLLTETCPQSAELGWQLEKAHAALFATPAQSLAKVQAAALREAARKCPATWHAPSWLTDEADRLEAGDDN